MEHPKGWSLRSRVGNLPARYLLASKPLTATLAPPLAVIAGPITPTRTQQPGNRCHPLLPVGTSRTLHGVSGWDMEGAVPALGGRPHSTFYR